MSEDQKPGEGLDLEALKIQAESPYTEPGTLRPMVLGLVAEIRRLRAAPTPEAQPPAALVQACLAVWKEFDDWNNPLMRLEPKEQQWMRYFKALQVMRDLAESLAAPHQGEQGGTHG